MIKQPKPYSRPRLLFFCDKCAKHFLLKSRAEIQEHLEEHDRSKRSRSIRSCDRDC